MSKYKVQFFGPTVFLRAETKEDAEELAVQYMGDEFPHQHFAIEAEADDSIPDDLLVEVND